MCLSCAVPVRGKVFGVECLKDAIGPDAPVDTVAAPRPSRAAWMAMGVGSAAAVLCTALPWTRFGDGSTPFGAWALSPRWSMLAALSAVLGLLAWLLFRMPGDRLSPVGGVILVVLAVLEATGAALAIANPPPFTDPAAGAWIGLGAGIVATIGALALVARSGHRGR